MERRTFLDFILKGAAVSVLPMPLVSCATDSKSKIIFKGLDPQTADLFQLMDGLSFELLIKQGDQISENDHFGSNNDYTAIVPKPGGDGYMLWVNHEYLNPLFVHGKANGVDKTLEDVHLEMYEVGGSLVELTR